MFNQHPPHIKRRIALVITVGVALVLLALLILVYTTKRVPVTDQPTATFKHFYTTILDSGQPAVVEK